MPFLVVILSIVEAYALIFAGNPGDLKTKTQIIEGTLLEAEYAFAGFRVEPCVESEDDVHIDWPVVVEGTEPFEVPVPAGNWCFLTLEWADDAVVWADIDGREVAEGFSLAATTFDLEHAVPSAELVEGADLTIALELVIL